MMAQCPIGNQIDYISILVHADKKNTHTQNTTRKQKRNTAYIENNKRNKYSTIDKNTRDF